MDDIICTLEWLDFLRIDREDMKRFVICIDESKMRQLEKKYVFDKSNVLQARMDKLEWRPAAKE